ncbi:large ribosomal subunit protein mL52 [Maniola hyperantus]|uniref:large ribosomal subunit protein mL52 n=1 Tax=Aphantopus hyperantus TaxID=2795564 RepID=UPI001567C9F4|nr:39S ribosomal protein L52, mitochondrial [Maniola hyperantus]
MSRFVKTLTFSSYTVVRRSFTCTAMTQMKQWRVSKGLSANRNAEGVLTDGPDYTFLDGRPTPLLQKQKQRMLKQQEFANQIVTLCSEVDFAKRRHQDMVQAKEQERQDIINNRLKPKGNSLLRKK